MGSVNELVRFTANCLIFALSLAILRSARILAKDFFNERVNQLKARQPERRVQERP
jgi:hypothetical protein